MLLASCGRFGFIHGASPTQFANGSQMRSYRAPRFSVSLLVRCQSSCTHAAYFGWLNGSLFCPTPIVYVRTFGEIAARFHVSAFQGSGKSASMLAGTAPCRASMIPIQLAQLNETFL